MPGTVTDCLLWSNTGYLTVLRNMVRCKNESLKDLILSERKITCVRCYVITNILSIRVDPFILNTNPAASIGAFSATTNTGKDPEAQISTVRSVVGYDLRYIFYHTIRPVPVQLLEFICKYKRR